MKVSVIMITYNHESYVAQAIESILMQVTSFDYEIVIGEDCSTDRTREIVASYAQKYPNRVRALLRETNLGMHHNFLQTYQACRGEFIAYLEGDDYWTDVHKLQKQVAFLESHPECASCCHPVYVEDETGVRDAETYPPLGKRLQGREIYTLEDLLYQCFVPGCSNMFRRWDNLILPEWFYELPMGDWPLHVFTAERGNIGYLRHEVMAVYRVHRGGVWSTQKLIKRLRSAVKFYKIINPYLNYRYRDLIRDRIAYLYYWMALESLSNLDRTQAVVSMIRSSMASPFAPEVSFGLFVKLFVKSLSPNGYRMLSSVKKQFAGGY